MPDFSWLHHHALILSQHEHARLQQHGMIFSQAPGTGRPRSIGELEDCRFHIELIGPPATGLKATILYPAAPQTSLHGIAADFTAFL